MIQIRPKVTVVVTLHAFLQKIGFLSYCPSDGSSSSPGTWTETVNDLGGWRYTRGYARSKKDEWIDGVHGAVVRGDARFGLGNLTGYDVAAAIRAWLKGSGSEQLSACEAILLRGEMEGLRKYVGRAGIFWSHVQQEP